MFGKEGENLPAPLLLPPAPQVEGMQSRCTNQSPNIIAAMPPAPQVEGCKMVYQPISSTIAATTSSTSREDADWCTNQRTANNQRWYEHNTQHSLPVDWVWTQQN